MGVEFSEEALRNWLVDYLVTNIGCSPDDVDVNASMNDMGVGSRDAVVLSGELSELLGRQVSPVEFWQHSSIAALAAFLTGNESDADGEAELDPRHGTLDEPIAVIGIGCRLPGDIDEADDLWQFMCEGRTAVTEVPPQRWAPFDDGSPEVAAALDRTTRWGSFLDDVDAFDAEFFEISSREAAKMDPQQRLLLEVAWEAFENAGIPPGSLRRSQTGVYVGASIAEYGYHASSDLTAVDAWSNSGAALSIIANRLSYFLDLRGPSMTVDTACSSSLVALHLACQSLRTQDCDVALAAGVNLLMAPSIFRGFDQSGALSATGACHAFDAEADGFVRGEGCATVVLKRLSDAVRDGNRVLAVVRGSAINQDGRSNGLLAPNPAAQMAVLRTAYANAGVPPQEVDYVEAHGTGTLLGDPIEARALGTVLGRGRPADVPLLIGAAKTNLGHLESAAGMVGFLKTVMAVQRGVIPKTRGFNTPNPHIAFDQLRLKVVDENQEWPAVDGRPRRAGVSSFGFGGANAHVVIEQAPDTRSQQIAQSDPPVSTLVLTGKSTDRIASLADNLADWMDGAGAEVGLPDIAHTLNHHREVHSQFATVCARDRANAVEALRALAGGRSADGLVAPHEGSSGQGTVFVYSGQGAHWTGMGRQLLADEPAFARTIAALDPVFTEQVGFSLWQVISHGEPLQGDAQVQPVTMGLQLGLTELWRSYGVHPDAVIGHSMGEVTAAVVAGALTPADGFRVIAARSQLMSRMAGQGAVALVNLNAEDTEALLSDYPDVSIAGYVSPRQTVIAGPVAPVDAAIEAVRARNLFARRVNMEVASHTALMDPILPELRSALADLHPQQPIIPFISTVTDDTVAPRLDADYWVANVRQPARVSQAVAVAGEQNATFIEVSAHPILTHAISDTLDPSAHHHSLGTLSRVGDDAVSFHTNLNATHTSHPPQTPHPPEPHPVLPPTPWHHERFWESPETVRRTVGQKSAPGANTTPIPADWWTELTWPARESVADGTAAADTSWLVIGDADTGAEMRDALGGSVTVLDPSVLDSDAAGVADSLAGVTHVLYAPAVTSGQFDGTAAGYGLFHAVRRLTVALAALASPPRLFLLTRNAQPIGEADRANPAHAVLWGVGRTLALEHPELWGAVIDADESVPADLVARYVIDEALSSDDEDQVVYRAGVRRVPRMVPTNPPAAAAALDADGCHLVIGATGHIGPQLVRQLADMGAKTIVTVSRNPGAKLDELAADLSAAGTELVSVAADAADETAMTALFERFGADLPQLRGIYLGAFAGGPTELLEMSDEDITAMFRPKLDVLGLLHKLSVRHPVRQFVLFSSISGLTGSRWLAHYTATSTFLDTFAFARRAAGLPATTVNWGYWKSLADSQSEQERQVTIDSGLMPMPDETAISALPWVLGADAPVRSTVVAADWPLLAAAYRTRAALHIVDELLEVETGAAADDVGLTEFRQALGESEPSERRQFLLDHVTAQVAAAMGLASPQLVDPSEGFFQAGMDSLMSVTLQRSLSESLGEKLSSAVVFDYPTAEALTDHLATLLPEVGEVDDEDDEDEYDDLSDDELLQQLSQKLG